MKNFCHGSKVKKTCLYMLLLSFMGALSACGHMFYYPTQGMYVDVNKLEPRPQQIEFETSDKKKVIGWYFQPESKKAKARLLYFHGNGQNLSSHFIGLYWILKEDYEFMIFDYPGYGGSEGEPTQQSTTDSGKKALEWLNQQEPQLPVVIFGQSLGGNVALYTAATTKDPNTCMVVVESTFKSYPKVAQRVMAGHWTTWLFQLFPYLVISDSYSANNVIQDIAPTPLIVIHGDADPIVKIKNGEDVFAAAKAPKEFWKVPGGGHIQAFTGDHKEVFRKQLVAALEKNCKK
ncbi:putative hydrolase [compost metagenome]